MDNQACVFHHFRPTDMLTTEQMCPRGRKPAPPQATALPRYRKTEINILNFCLFVVLHLHLFSLNDVSRPRDHKTL